MIKFCKKCQEEKRENCPSGYYYGWKDTVTHCPNCGNKFIDIDFPKNDLIIIEDISEDVSFIESMIKLRETDIIEYNLKMSQFKAQLSQIQAQKENSKPHCPTCSSTDIKKISTTSKAVNTALWGIFFGGTKRHKTFCCNSCGYEW